MPSPAQLSSLARWIGDRRRLVVLTGAGCSTESGIPDYRDETGAWKRPSPMTYQDFTGSPEARRRYWARAAIGWQRMRSVQPGRAHRALALLEQAGLVNCLITQNVDGLHQRAGSQRVIDLHGRIDTVQCLACGQTLKREQVQSGLEAANPGWSALPAAAAPDGDAVIEEAACERFTLIDCPSCGGILKPAVVFFGESVPAEVVQKAYAAVEGADGLLVVGSSLMVYSGYRFVRTALERGVSIALLNRGRTRADAEASIKIEAACGEVLEAVVQRVLGFPRQMPGETSITIDCWPSILDQRK
jgi:NAD-dependent SIR2 family protein deacetylase